MSLFSYQSLNQRNTLDFFLFILGRNILKRQSNSCFCLSCKAEMPSWRTNRNEQSGFLYPAADRQVLPLAADALMFYCLLLMSACCSRPLGLGRRTSRSAEGLLLTVNPPATSPPAHYCTPSTVIDWPLPSPSPSRSLPDRSLTLSETPLLSGEVIWVRAPLVFMLPRRWGKKTQKLCGSESGRSQEAVSLICPPRSRAN